MVRLILGGAIVSILGVFLTTSFVLNKPDEVAFIPLEEPLVVDILETTSTKPVAVASVVETVVPKEVVTSKPAPVVQAPKPTPVPVSIPVVEIPVPAPPKDVIVEPELSPEYIPALEEQAIKEREWPKPPTPLVAGSLEPEPAPTPEPEPEPTPEPEPEPVVEETVQDTGSVVIYEVQITGGTGKTKHDYVTLYNGGASDFNLKGFRLVKRTKTGTSDTSLKSWTADTVIPAGGYFTWANSEYVGSVTPDETTSGTLSNNNGVALREGKANEGTIIDSLAWGSAENSFIEGNVFDANPGAGEVLRRENGDTDDNGVDFVIR